MNVFPDRVNLLVGGSLLFRSNVIGEVFGHNLTG